MLAIVLPLKSKKARNEIREEASFVFVFMIVPYKAVNRKRGTIQERKKDKGRKTKKGPE